MTTATRFINGFSPIASKTRSVRISPDGADFVATHAQRFARTAVTCRANIRLAPSRRAVVITRFRRTEPTLGMRIRLAVCRGNTLTCMARTAHARRMTRRAQSGIRSRFFAVARGESGAMNAETRRIVEKHSFRQERRRYAMTTQAGSFGMAIHAQLLLRRRTNSMLAHEIPRMNQMVVGTNPFVLKVDVTGVAAILGEVFFMGVAASASRHFGAEDFAAAGDIDMAADAIAGRSRGMGAMFESQMFPGHLRTAASLGQAVTTIAIAIVVGFFMTIDAILGRREMQRSFVSRSGGSGVAFAAMNSFEHVRTVFEGASFGRTNAQNGCAGRRKEQARTQQERRRFGFHGPLHVWLRRASARTAAVFVGDALASTAPDNSQNGRGE